MGLFEKFEWDPDYVPPVKLSLHVAQIVFAFVVFILEIIVFRDSKSKINGNNGWTFGLCFLSIPAWIYLIMAPRWRRTQRLAAPNAMLVIDVTTAILWLTGFATQAAYDTANSCGNACNVSKAIVGIAFFIFLFWCCSSFLSFYTLKYYQSNGTLPGYDNLGRRRTQNIDPDKAAFSMAPHDEEAYAPINDEEEGEEHNAPYNADSYNSRPMFDSDTEYRPHSVTPAPQDPNAPKIYAPPAASSYDPDAPARFPEGNYDRTL